MRQGRGYFRTTTIAFLWVFINGCIPFAPLSGQSEVPWGTLTTIGYGGLGCGAGFLVTSEAIRAADRTGAQGPVSILGTVAGCWAGGRIGRTLGKEAERLLSRGESLPPGQRRGVQLGTILAGASLGTLISFVHVGSQEGRDAEIITAYALTGAGLGLMAQLFLNHHLDPGGSSPTLLLQGGPTGGFSFGAGLRF